MISLVRDFHQNVLHLVRLDNLNITIDFIIS